MTVRPNRSTSDTSTRFRIVIPNQPPLTVAVLVILGGLVMNFWVMPFLDHEWDRVDL